MIYIVEYETEVGNNYAGGIDTVHKVFDDELDAHLFAMRVKGSLLICQVKNVKHNQAIYDRIKEIYAEQAKGEGI